MKLRWHRWRGEVLASGAVIGALTVLGAVLAVLWWQVAPQLDIVASPRGALIAQEQPEEYISSDGRFGLIVGVAGIVAGLAGWLVRRFRGPHVLIALALGALAGSWVMWQVGEEIGTVHGRDIVSVLAAGERDQVPIVELHALGLLFLQPLLAVVTYVVCVSWSSTPELRPTRTVPTQEPWAPSVGSAEAARDRPETSPAQSSPGTPGW